MDAASNDDLGAYRGESVLKKLRKKYIKRAKRVKHTSLGAKTTISGNNLNIHSSLSGPHSVVPLGYKRKIQDLLVNNSELAKSLEWARLENCRLEKDNSLFQRQLNLRPIVESKLMEVSTNLSLAASLISETVSMIMEAKQFLLGENTMDTVLTTDSLSKSDDSQRFSHKTPEDNPIPGPSNQKDTWQPCRLRGLDMSTIAEVSVMCDETRNLLSCGITPAVRGLTSLEELNRSTPEVFAKPANERIVSIAGATQQNATPENKELEPSDETPKTPILLSQKLFPSLIPKAVVQCLPFKKRSSYPESQEQVIPMISSNIVTETTKVTPDENIVGNVNSRRGTGKLAKTKSGNTNKIADNKNDNYHEPENVEVAPPNTSDYTVTTASNNLNADPQIINHPSSRKTFVVQNKFPFPGINPVSSTSPDFSKNKRSTATKKISSKSKSRRDTFLVSKDEANAAHPTMPNVLENAEDLMLSQTTSVSRKLKKVPRIDVNQIQEEMDVGAPSTKNTDNAASDTKNEKFINSQSSVFENILLTGESYRVNITPDAHSSSKLTKDGDECKLFPDTTTCNFIDMSLTEVINLHAACMQATEREDNPNMQVVECGKIFGNESIDLKPELAVDEITSCEIPTNNVDAQFLKVDQETVENCAINPKPTPMGECIQSKKHTLETPGDENNDGVGQTKKLMDKKSVKKGKKTSTSKASKKDAKDHVSSRSKKKSSKDKTSNKKGKLVNQPDSLPNEVAPSLLLLPSQKRKSPIHDIYDDGLNVVSPRRAKEMEAANNVQLDQNCSLSTSSKNKNSESLKAIENIPNSKGNDLVPSPKKIKLEIESENNSLVNRMDLSTNLDLPIVIEICPQAETSNNHNKDLAKATKANKKTNAPKKKKAKPDSAASNRKRSVDRPKTKVITDAEKENEQVRLNDMSDFYSPVPKVKMSKPPKKKGRPPKTPLKAQNTKDKHTEPLNEQENVFNSHSNPVTDHQNKCQPVVEVENIFLPIKGNIGPDFLSSSFELKSGSNTLKITSPTTGSIELILPQPGGKLLADAKPNTPKAAKDSIASRYTNSVSVEKTRPSVNSSIMDSAPRRRRQAMSYREPSLHSKLRRA